MAKPKCQFCRKEVEKSTGYCERIKNKNYWFCNENEYLLWQKDKDAEEEFFSDATMMFDLNIDIYEKSSWTMINNYIKTLLKDHSREEILWYLECNMERVVQILNRKTFDSEFGMLRYMMAVINNSINTFLRTTPLPPKQDNKVPVDEFYMAPANYRPSKIRRAMSYIEQTEDDDE